MGIERILENRKLQTNSGKMEGRVSFTSTIQTEYLSTKQLRDKFDSRRLPHGLLEDDPSTATLWDSHEREETRRYDNLKTIVWCDELVSSFQMQSIGSTVSITYGRIQT